MVGLWIAHKSYLSLSPLHRSEVRPDMAGFTDNFTAERYMRKHLLLAMPTTIQATLLHMQGGQSDVQAAPAGGKSRP